MDDLRKGCPMRHENGNCTVIGGFCTAVNDSICEGLHNAYDNGYRDAAIRARQERENTKPMANADRIRAMSDEELAEFIRSMVDGSNSHSVACYGCIYYGTHHSDPANKGTYLYECDGCENEGIGLDVLEWLQQPAEGE